MPSFEHPIDYTKKHPDYVFRLMGLMAPQDGIISMRNPRVDSLTEKVIETLLDKGGLFYQRVMKSAYPFRKNIKIVNGKIVKGTSPSSQCKHTCPSVRSFSDLFHSFFQRYEDTIASANEIPSNLDTFHKAFIKMKETSPLSLEEVVLVKSTNDPLKTIEEKVLKREYLPVLQVLERLVIRCSLNARAIEQKTRQKFCFRDAVEITLALPTSLLQLVSLVQDEKGSSSWWDNTILDPEKVYDVVTNRRSHKTWRLRETLSEITHKEQRLQLEKYLRVYMEIAGYSEEAIGKEAPKIARDNVVRLLTHPAGFILPVPQTPIGKEIIQPIVDEIDKLHPAERAPNTRTLEIVHSALQSIERRLGELDIMPADLYFLCSLTVEPTLRRGIFYTWLSEKVRLYGDYLLSECTEDTSKQRRYKEELVSYIKGSSWTSFFSALEKSSLKDRLIINAPDQHRSLREARSECSDYAYSLAYYGYSLLIHLQRITIGDTKNLMSLHSECVKMGLRRFDSTDLGHGLKWTETFRSSADTYITANNNLNLVKATRLLVIEDGIEGDALYESLHYCTNLSFMPFPRSMVASTNISIREWENRGRYYDASRALGALELIWETDRTKIPNVILTDIEVAGEMTGLEFVEILKSKLPDYNPEVIIVSSSSYSRYRNRLLYLENRGMITGFLNKLQGLTGPRLVNMINEFYKQQENS